MKIKKNKVQILILIIVIIIVFITIMINIVLKIYYEHKMELQDELMCKTVEENSEYYTDFSKEFLNIVKIKNDSENGTYPYPFSLSSVKNEMETPLNNDLIGDWAYVMHIDIEGEDVWYVDLELPYYISEFEYWFVNSYTYIQEYIPDEYMTDSNLEVILRGKYEPPYRNGNLLVMRRLTNRYPT
jgi:hypothetical protein